MSQTKEQLWVRFQQYYTEFSALDLALDLSRVLFPADYFERMMPWMERAWDQMDAIERGEKLNTDEGRQVGHYWLRAPELAPADTTYRHEIESTLARLQEFARGVHQGAITGAGGKFRFLLLIGIGGSALGPQLVSNALAQPGKDKMELFFFDNTDPDGMDRILARLKGKLGRTLCLVISKSGGTKETRNGMIEAQKAYQAAGLDFARHAVAVTCFDLKPSKEDPQKQVPVSELFDTATRDNWLDRFPMWEWVGGRTSLMSAVGLLPAALQGIKIEKLLAGARDCDHVTRQRSLKANPAAQLALMWYHATSGCGAKDMVILPYKDRLELMAKYLQQLIMESLGKELDRSGQQVFQGITVYGNKGSTDQHAYVQQLRDGVANFFVTFIEVLHDRKGPSAEVEPMATTGDFLHGFFLGTRQALADRNRESITLTLKEISPYSLGVLIALYERTVGLYAALIHVNAYHQPGVQAGKKAAEDILALQRVILPYLKIKAEPQTVFQIAFALQRPEDIEHIFKICEHLAANPSRNIKKKAARKPFDATYQWVEKKVES